VVPLLSLSLKTQKNVDGMKNTYTFYPVLCCIFIFLSACHLTRAEKQNRYAKRHWKQIAQKSISAQRITAKDTFYVFQQVFFIETDTPIFHSCHYNKRGKKDGLEIIHTAQNTTLNYYKNGIEKPNAKLLKQYRKFGLNHFVIENGDSVRLYQWFLVDILPNQKKSYDLLYYKKGKPHGIKLEYERSLNNNAIDYPLHKFSYRIQRYRYGRRHGITGSFYYSALHRFGKLIWEKQIIPNFSF
jgi:hypothetical protein